MWTSNNNPRHETPAEKDVRQGLQVFAALCAVILTGWVIENWREIVRVLQQ